jgi:hypothetical protein
MRMIIVSGLTMSLAIGARASDADLQRALLEAGCVRAEIKPLPRRGEASIYEANCFGSSHKVLEVVCIDGRCMTSHASHQQDEMPD